MLVLRSLVFNLLFYVNTIGTLVVTTPVFLFGSQHRAMGVVRYYARSSLWLARTVCRLGYEIRGIENIPDGACLIAPKHQSIWETFALIKVFGDAAVVIKKQLLYVPFWGWAAWRTRMIFVDRGKGTAALRQIAAGARRELALDRSVMIYPEGTRRPPGAPPAYKFGVTFLYRSLGVPVLPIALNSGLYWPRRSFRRHPGTIIVEILPPIPPGLPPATFATRLETDMEAACDRLLVEAAGARPAPPFPQAAAERLQALAHQAA